jgi:hypothetical protein
LNTREILTASPINVIDKSCVEFDSSFYNLTHLPVDAGNFVTIQNNNNSKFYEFNSSENSWPYDLSRTSTSLEYSALRDQPSANIYNTINSNFRNYGPFYNNGAMKGNLNFLSPPHSSPSDSTLSSNYGNDNNTFSSSYINIDYTIHDHTNYLDEFFNDENCLIVEDSGHYTTLTAAVANPVGAPGFDMYLQDQMRNFGHQHSTSSGDSRSPDAFTTADDYDTGMQNFTQLTSLTTRTNGLYNSSPGNVNVTDGMISNYESAGHAMTPTR